MQEERVHARQRSVGSWFPHEEEDTASQSGVSSYFGRNTV
jgi:hypothetical protein